MATIPATPSLVPGLSGYDPSLPFPDNQAVTPITLVGPADTNLQPEEGLARDLTLQAAVNGCINTLNAILVGGDDGGYVFLRRDGSNAMTGSLNMGGHSIADAADPANAQDVATKNYVDVAALRVNGSNAMSANLNMGSNRSVLMAEPANPSDGATKNYVDTHSAGRTAPPNPSDGLGYILNTNPLVQGTRRTNQYSGDAFTAAFTGAFTANAYSCVVDVPLDGTNYASASIDVTLAVNVSSVAHTGTLTNAGARILYSLQTPSMGLTDATIFSVGLALATTNLAFLPFTPTVSGLGVIPIPAVGAPITAPLMLSYGDLYAVASCMQRVSLGILRLFFYVSQQVGSAPYVAPYATGGTNTSTADGSVVITYQSR